MAYFIEPEDTPPRSEPDPGLLEPDGLAPSEPLPVSVLSVFIPPRSDAVEPVPMLFEPDTPLDPLELELEPVTPEESGKTVTPLELEAAPETPSLDAPLVPAELPVLPVLPVLYGTQSTPLMPTELPVPTPALPLREPAGAQSTPLIPTFPPPAEILDELDTPFEPDDTLAPEDDSPTPPVPVVTLVWLDAPVPDEALDAEEDCAVAKPDAASEAMPSAQSKGDNRNIFPPSLVCEIEESRKLHASAGQGWQITRKHQCCGEILAAFLRYRNHKRVQAF